MAEKTLLKSKEVKYHGISGDIELRLVKLSDNLGDGNFHLRTVNYGAFLECTCVDCGANTWDELMKGATRANKKEVIKIAFLAGVIDEEQARMEIKKPYYNPFTHYKTKTHIIYVHSAIEHFIRIN